MAAENLEVQNDVILSFLNILLRFNTLNVSTLEEKKL